MEEKEGEDRWARLERILESVVRRVVDEALNARGLKAKTRICFTNGKWTGITDEQLSTWKVAYGSVDIEAELNKAAAWIVSNPSLAPKREYARFMNTWLSRTQDRSAIRSIPTRSEIKPPNLCAYCGLPSTGSANGYRHCQAHLEKALYNETPPRFMPGVTAKPVAGS